MSVLKSLLRKPSSFFIDHLSGSLISKSSDISEGIVTLIPILFERSIGLVTVLGLSMITVYSAGVKYCCIIGLWVGIFLYISYYTSSKIKNLASLAGKARSQFNGLIQDVVSNIDNVRYFSSTDQEQLNIENSAKKVMKAELTRDLYSNRVFILKTVLFVILCGLCFCFLFIDYKAKKITPGDFTLILSINFLLSDYLSVLSKNFYRFSEIRGNIRQGVETIFAPDFERHRKLFSKLAVPRGDISFSKVFFSYPKGRPVLKNLSLVIKGGTKVGIVGHSGAGKTTLVNLLLGKYHPKSGVISIDGQDISLAAQDALFRSISVIPQNIHLFHRTIRENVLYGYPSASQDSMIQACQIAHIHEYIQSLEKGYDTLVGESGVKLSGGQRQRVAIARAVLKDSPIIVLDEATSSLDSYTERVTKRALARVMESKTAIVIAHRISTIMNLDRILVLDEGQIVEDGTHDELLLKNGIYANLWSNQVNGFLGDMATSGATV